ncbi:hypothetical protein SYK_24490 [Pseudodesulfovibrio nedwellii]|uniref:Methyltransferase FkbM domain-containing protein n=1 Tax=Pseudodesulfovibrio nedwellii TaxID=2973072 RepID=A0ABN6S4D7_9BACT|nr:FkbM family methyltransferase [Pseudodesulfovibrio nedwellii]BDQ38089.1 hypothetical protein SYK_24490 [Pseudodesulfovibrio nedwellii]
MLSNLTVADLDGGINFVDIGCSGDLDKKWEPVSGLINYVGFDPNEEECRRLNAEPSSFNSRLFVPFAVHDGKEHSLYKTHSIYCYSLLEPNMPWLDRFAYNNLFQVEGTEQVQTHRLDDVDAIKPINVDVIKVDSQGLDKRILENGQRLVDQALYIEAEPGFTENYVGEDTFTDVDVFLRNRGLRLFDLELFRSARNNPLGKVSPKQQLMWCQGVWLHDLVAPSVVFQPLTRAKALKALLICAIGDFLDYGYELAAFFHGKGLIDDNEFKSLSEKKTWEL